MLRSTALTIVATTLSLPAQTPAGPTIPATKATALSADAVQARLKLAASATASGARDAARSHLEAALILAPDDPDILRQLVLNAEAGSDARCAYALRWSLAAMEADGKLNMDRSFAAELPDATTLRQLAKARAAAVAELAKFATKLKAGKGKAAANGLIVSWANGLAWELARESTALRTAHGPALRRAAAQHKPDATAVLKALRKLAANPPSTPVEATGGAATGPASTPRARSGAELAMRAAQCLTGLAAQANFKKLEGPPPPSGAKRLAESGAELRSKLRQGVSAKVGEPWTVERLEELDEDERAAFTREHDHWANPGVAVSPGGLYRIETTCGLETLLGAAQTVELHHARLANWYGKDPFTTQGTVRIVPEHDGLESEDAPFWWAGGFQSGDFTTLRFAWSDVAALGHGLTHELTHRFDGKVFAFLPAWLVEGRAVWTASAYGVAEDDKFVANRLDTGTVQKPFVDGYGRRAKLETLLEGTMDDYRDNYTAGYALFAYLSMWEKGGKTIYAEPLQRYMRNARGGRKKPVQFFADHFADGKNGRPADFDGFVTEFKTFIEECYRISWGEIKPAWLRHYARSVNSDGARVSLVDDEPSWSWARQRAEPWFGQRHAALAGRLFEEIGDARTALSAMLWSLHTDGWERESVAAIERSANELRQKDVAWIAAHRLGHAEGDAPMLSSLPKLRAFLEAHESASSTFAAATRPISARATAAIHLDTLRKVRAGAKSLGTLPAAPESSPLPETEQPAALGRYGLTESGLTRFEDRRREGLWFTTDAGDVHVGREKPRDVSGLLDRRAQQRDAFVYGADWQPAGDYVVRGRVHFTTSYVKGAIILGHTRRDRNLRLNFRAGDFLYSLGKKDATETTESVSLNMTGLWERGGRLPNTRPRKEVQFDKPASSFGFALHVSGPTVRVVVEDKTAFTYTTPDGSPIEGHVGFAMGHGAVRVQEPTIQRLDRDDLRLGASRSVAFDPEQDPAQTRKELLARPTRGIPLGRHGTIVLWIPATDARSASLAKRALRGLADEFEDSTRYPQRWVLALPQALEAPERSALAKRMQAALPDRSATITHQHSGPFDAFAWIFFVDASGILRAANGLGARGALPAAVQTWARRYRTR